MTKIRAVIFDMDGVLIDAKPWHYEALNKALVDFGYKPIEMEDHLENYDGLPTRKKLSILSKIQNIPESLFEDINKLKQKYTQEIANEKCSRTEYHINALYRLKSDGYKLALCSNSVRKSVDLMMGKSGLTPYFDFMLSYEDVSKPKPDPAIYKTAIENLGIMPREALILEDNKNGIIAAIKSGAFLYRIIKVSEVTYENIKRKIHWLENEYKDE